MSVTVGFDDVARWSGDVIEFLATLPARGPDITMPVGCLIWGIGVGMVLGSHVRVHEIFGDQIPWGGSKPRNIISVAWILFIVGGIGGVVQAATR